MTDQCHAPQFVVLLVVRSPRQGELASYNAAARNLSSVVVGEEVGGTRADAGDAVGQTKSLDAGSDGRGARETLNTHEVGSETSNVGAGHGGTRDGVGGSVGADPGREDGRAGGEDVNGGSVVGERGAGVGGGGGTDGDGRGLRSRGVVGGGGVIVTSSNNEGHASVDGSGDSGVDGRGLATTERHAGDGLGALALVPGSVGGPLDTRDDTGVGARAIGTEDLDGDDIGLLGDTVGAAGDGASAVSSVAVAISVGGVGEVGAPAGTAAELGVADLDTSVDNVDINTLAGLGIVVVGAQRRAGSLLGDAAETPGGTRLRGDGVGVDIGILLNVGDLGGLLDLL